MTSGPRRKRIDGPSWLALVAEILDRCPSLPGGLCRDDPRLWDGDTYDGERTAAAIAACRRCPVFADCREWADAQKHRRLRGVVGGRYRGAARDVAQERSAVER